MSNENFNTTILKVCQVEPIKLKTNFNINIDNAAQIDKIISITPCINDVKIEPNKNKANISGKLNLKVVYIDTDGLFNSINDFENFDDTININDCDVSSSIIVNNISYEIEDSYDDKHLKIKVISNFDCCLYDNEKLNTNLDCNNLITKINIVKSSYLYNTNTSTFSDEINIKVNDNINKILYYNLEIKCLKISTNSNYTTLSGDYHLHIIYENSNSEISIVDNYIPYSQQLEITFDNDNTELYCKAKTLQKSIEIKTTLNDNTTNLTFTFDNEYTIYAFKTSDVSLTEDAFSTNFEIDTDEMIVSLNERIVLPNLETIINNEIEVKESEIINSIIDVINTCYDITKTNIENNCAVIEGLLYSTVIYRNEEDKVRSINIEAPFILKLNTPQLNCEKYILIPDICIESNKARIKRGNTLDIDFSISCTTQIFEIKNYKCLSKATPTKTIQNNCSMQIFITKPNEDIWELCKRTRTSAEDIYKYNKNLTVPFKDNEKIIIFK